MSTINEGIELLTGRPAGARGGDGSYPIDSINRSVEERLRAFAAIRRNFTSQKAGETPSAN